MATSRILAIRTFNWTLSTDRWMYHTVKFSYNGQPISRLNLLGTLLFTIGPQSSSKRLTFSKALVWGSESGFFGIKVPNTAAMGNLFGATGLGTQGSGSIELVVRGEYPGSISFTEVTNLGVAP